MLSNPSEDNPLVNGRCCSCFVFRCRCYPCDFMLKDDNGTWTCLDKGKDCEKVIACESATAGQKECPYIGHGPENIPKVLWTRG